MILRWVSTQQLEIMQDPMVMKPADKALESWCVGSAHIAGTTLGAGTAEEKSEEASSLRLVSQVTGPDRAARSNYPVPPESIKKTEVQQRISFPYGWACMEGSGLTILFSRGANSMSQCPPPGTHLL